MPSPGCTPTNIAMSIGEALEEANEEKSPSSLSAPMSKKEKAFAATPKGSTMPHGSLMPEEIKTSPEGTPEVDSHEKYR